MAKLILADVLKKKKLSKRQFALRLGEAYNNVFRYFRTGYDPRWSTMEKWAKALGVRIRDLFKE